LWFSAIFLCGFIIFGAFIWLDLGASLRSGRDRTLGRRAERLADLLEKTEHNPAADLQKQYTDFVDGTPEGRLIQVYSLSGERLLPAANAPAAAFPWPSIPTSGTEFRSDTSFKGQIYHVFVRPSKLNGAPVRIFVAGQLTDDRNLQGRLAEILARCIPGMLLVSALAGYFISRRALKPVASLTASARSITIGNLAARLPVSPAGDELAQLADTCNEMLSRLEEAVKRITQFTADASHELRSPVALIRATSEDALHIPGLNADAAQAFANIVRETDHSSRLLEDLLLLARSDAGRVQLNYEPVFLTDIVRDVISRTSPLMQRKQQRVIERIPDEELQLRGDTPMLRRLVWILLDNAIKYTPCGGRIDVTLVRDGPYARLIVSDNGIGVPEELLPNIFDRFFRVDASRSEQEGTGLGLAIGKWIAAAHRATITARSLNRAGTTFEIAFPLSENQGPA
jgi:heavy metal sensor kinase